MLSPLFFLRTTRLQKQEILMMNDVFFFFFFFHSNIQTDFNGHFPASALQWPSEEENKTAVSLRCKGKERNRRYINYRRRRKRRWKDIFGGSLIKIEAVSDEIPRETSSSTFQSPLYPSVLSHSFFVPSASLSSGFPDQW